MGRTDRWLLADLFRALGLRKGHESVEQERALPPINRLHAACSVLMSDVGEASLRAVASRALEAYQELDEAEKLVFFHHILDTYGADADEVITAYHAWEESRGHDELADLFDAAEPHRQQLLRRMNHAPGATLAIVEMRADLRRLLGENPELKPLDRDFHHLLTSWFNRGFLQMRQITRDAPKKLQRHLIHYEKVHPMGSRAELRRRLQPKDRRIYAFFHPATGELPLIFVEVALTRGVPGKIAPLLTSESSIPPQKADTAVLYSINNALDGLAGISFGSLLIKQVIEQIGEELPHLQHYVTLSPLPGFRRWLEQEAKDRLQSGDSSLEQLTLALKMVGAEHPEAPEESSLRAQLAPAAARYVAHAQRVDGKPLDPVARFHLGNGAAAWRLSWPADSSAAAWEQSYGVMINYRYEPELLERRHEEFIRHGRIALGDEVEQLLKETSSQGDGPLKARTAGDHTAQEEGVSPMSELPATIYQAFAQQASARPEKPLFLLPGGGSLSYAQTMQAVDRIAAVLIADGVRPGDRVAMQVEKSPEAIALYLATLRVGGVFLPLNTAYTGKEMDYFLEDAGPKVLVVDPAQAVDHQERNAVVGGSLILETLSAEGEGTLLRAEVASEDKMRYDAAPEEPASILYTSGTTGRSKGAVLTHRNLVSNCQALLQTWEYTSEDTLIHALPIFHIHGLFVAVNMTLAAGASMHWLPKFEAGRVIELLPRATVLMGVPTFYTRMLREERLTREVCAGMRLFVSGSAPLLATDHEAFEQRTGHAILERYGMTETGMNTTNPYLADPASGGGPRKPGTVGKPFPGVEVRVVERESGAELPDGEVGLVEVRGPNVFSGYWQMPEKTAAEFREEGFFITGDLGRFDEDGYLCIVGRDKDLIISGGYNVYPKEVEERLDAHPEVLESAVVGVPHPDYGESVLAVVVPAAGGKPRPEALEEFLSDELARFKQPRAYRIVESLPRNVMGKVQKAQLRSDYAEVFVTTEA